MCVFSACISATAADWIHFVPLLTDFDNPKPPHFEVYRVTFVHTNSPNSPLFVKSRIGSCSLDPYEMLQEKKRYSDLSAQIRVFHKQMSSKEFKVGSDFFGT